MPFISLHPPAGPVTVCYTISTPACNESNSINPSIPTVVLVVPYMTSQHIWHAQLNDRAFRRFNIVLFDPRGQGQTVGEIPEIWTEEEAADDIYHLLVALSIPGYHLVSLGASVGPALRVAILHPKEVLSVTAISPLPLRELEPILEGRKEMFVCWEAAVRSPDQQLKEDALKDAVTGGLMLATNGDRSPLIMAMVKIMTEYELGRSGTVEGLEVFERLSVWAYANRDSYPLDGLRRLECPVLLLHCSEDIAYPIGLAEEVRDRMEEAGVEVSLVSLSGAPHYGIVTHYESMTPMMHDFVLQHCKGAAPPIPESVESPFESDFAAVGCSHLGRDREDDLEFFS